MPWVQTPVLPKINKYIKLVLKVSFQHCCAMKLVWDSADANLSTPG
jgi:hypothetical protein